MNVNLNFQYNGNLIKIQATRDEYMKNIFPRFLTKINKSISEVFFMYNGSVINGELKLEEINNIDNEITILVSDCECDTPMKPKLVQSKDIICPECGEICLINIEDYKISLNSCINKHSKENILLDEYNDLQKIDESEIKCDSCNCSKTEVFSNKFYICGKCKINLCPICKLSHNNEHILIDFDLKNYYCNKHSENFILYCKECNKNLCESCQIEHDKNHKYNFLNELIIKKDYKDMGDLRKKIDNLKEEVNNITEKFNKIIDNMEVYYNIYNNIINNFSNKNKNYDRLININNLNYYNEIIIKDINKIINEDKYINKIKYLFNLYNKMATKNETILKYKIGSEDMIKIFGEIFVENNKNNFKMVINNENYKLNSFYSLENRRENEILEVKLIQIGDVENISHMFNGCSSLIELSDISKWNTSNITNMSHMFNKCSKLSSLPDISKWNTSNVTDMSYMFSECSELSSLPDISKWNTNNVNNMSTMFQLCSSLTELPEKG